MQTDKPFKVWFGWKHYKGMCSHLWDSLCEGFDWLYLHLRHTQKITEIVASTVTVLWGARSRSLNGLPKKPERLTIWNTKSEIYPKHSYNEPRKHCSWSSPISIQTFYSCVFRSRRRLLTTHFLPQCSQSNIIDCLSPIVARGDLGNTLML